MGPYMTSSGFSKDTSAFGRAVDAGRRIETVGGSVTADEKERIYRALEQAGYPIHPTRHTGCPSHVRAVNYGSRRDHQ